MCTAGVYTEFRRLREIPWEEGAEGTYSTTLITYRDFGKNKKG
jgi:hypothetical protein